MNQTVSAYNDTVVVTTETIFTLIALQSCDRVCIDFQWLLYSTVSAPTDCDQISKYIRTVLP